MKKFLRFSLLLLFAYSGTKAQQNLSPELLWQVKRLSALGMAKDGKHLLYQVAMPNVDSNKSFTKKYLLPLEGGAPVEITNTDEYLANKHLSPNGKMQLTSKEVKIKPVFGVDHYPDLPKSNVYIYDHLNYRHWDEWEDGKFGHVMLKSLDKPDQEIDLMKEEPYDCPQKPFGGGEDYIWNPNGESVVYVTKKKFGTDYAKSTNTDLYEYNIATGKTTNLTETNPGYDVAPAYNKNGVLAWLQMKRDGYEADKQDLVVYDAKNNIQVNLTRHRDDIHVESFTWSQTDNRLFFIAPVNGTQQLFEVNYAGLTRIASSVRSVTRGDFDITGIIGQSGNTLYVTRTDMNHAPEIYSVNLGNGNMAQLSHENDAFYAGIGQCKTERRFVTTTDGKKMLVWVIYPPGFDKSKKYPTLLYCQGGPQSPLTQFYSYRWNFQLMASQGYIIVAPNRRGMQGHGTKWNEQISKDNGGQVMKDYLSAIDALAKEPFVDKTRLGCVGASYGGYSAFYLAAFHNNRFKTFIAHDGIFDFKSMYGTTEELFFVDWEYGGNYWDKKNLAAQKSYNEFSPANFVAKWNRPILIYHGGKDYRVPPEQGFQAFQAAQLRGLKSKLVYLPDENHWVLKAQNALVWQREFFKWLKETL